MNKETFIKTINALREQDERVDNYNELIAYDSEFVQFGFLMFDTLIEEVFDEEGSSTIFWWLWERIPKWSPDAEPCKFYDDNGQEVKLDTVEDLWELVKKYLKE